MSAEKRCRWAKQRPRHPKRVLASTKGCRSAVKGPTALGVNWAAKGVAVGDRGESGGPGAGLHPSYHACNPACQPMY